MARLGSLFRGSLAQPAFLQMYTYTSDFKSNKMTREWAASGHLKGSPAAPAGDEADDLDSILASTLLGAKEGRSLSPARAEPCQCGALVQLGRRRAELSSARPRAQRLRA